MKMAKNKPVRPADEHEIKAINSLMQIRLGSGDRDFIWEMYEGMCRSQEAAEPFEITEQQGCFVASISGRYRKQLERVRTGIQKPRPPGSDGKRELIDGRLAARKNKQKPRA
jgi:hypothetical protein